MRLYQILDRVAPILIGPVLREIDKKALPLSLLTHLSVRSLQTQLYIYFDSQGLTFGELAQQGVKIQLQGVASHLNDHFAHELKLGGRIDRDFLTLSLRAFPAIQVVHGDDEQVFQLQRLHLLLALAGFVAKDLVLLEAAHGVFLAQSHQLAETDAVLSDLGLDSTDSLF